MEHLTTSVLVLNRNFIPLDTCSVKDAIILLYKGSARVVNREYQTFEFDRWVEYSQERDGPKIHSPNLSMLIPDTIMIPQYSDYPRRNIVLKYSRRNVFLRDHMCCQYCMKKGTYENLTIDHIVPKSKGGPNTYENVVSACKACNNAKRDRTPEESGMIPHSLPTTPSWHARIISNPNWVRFFKSIGV